ncbi:hypothetical protein QE152_g34486 [Popillia japonica]|uniref:Uncharacterized protein n=1 Tax=Popillia japonica TaxID=7064 RepID=A0AAW1ITK3_POPJA
MVLLKSLLRTTSQPIQAKKISPKQSIIVLTQRAMIGKAASWSTVIAMKLQKKMERKKAAVPTKGNDREGCIMVNCNSNETTEKNGKEESCSPKKFSFRLLQNAL